MYAGAGRGSEHMRETRFYDLNPLVIKWAGLSIGLEQRKGPDDGEECLVLRLVMKDLSEVMVHELHVPTAAELLSLFHGIHCDRLRVVEAGS